MCYDFTDSPYSYDPYADDPSFKLGSHLQCMWSMNPDVWLYASFFTMFTASPLSDWLTLIFFLFVDLTFCYAIAREKLSRWRSSILALFVAVAVFAVGSARAYAPFIAELDARRERQAANPGSQGFNWGKYISPCKAAYAGLIGIAATHFLMLGPIGASSAAVIIQLSSDEEAATQDNQAGGNSESLQSRLL